MHKLKNLEKNLKKKQWQGNPVVKEHLGAGNFFCHFYSFFFKLAAKQAKYSEYILNYLKISEKLSIE